MRITTRMQGTLQGLLVEAKDWVNFTFGVYLWFTFALWEYLRFLIIRMFTPASFKQRGWTHGDQFATIEFPWKRANHINDFEDIVLVESPFAETNRHGIGLRQVQIGLTPTKLITARYFVESLEGEEPRPGRDPDIESFELVSAYPVECVNMSVFRHRQRQTLKVRLCDGKVSYYEIGGWQERKMLWTVWCERIKFLSPYETGTSASETSVASSSSGSSLYIVRSTLSVSQTGQPTLWCHYAASESTNTQGSWADPHLYLGPAFFEKGINFINVPEIVKINKNRKRLGKFQKRNTFQQPLALSPELEKVAREAVELWESQGRLLAKVRRRHGFYPCPGLLAGLGLGGLSRPQAFSLQVKRTVSLVHLPAARDAGPGQLVRPVSLERLAVPALSPDKLFQLSNDAPARKSLEFWVPSEGSQVGEHKQQASGGITEEKPRVSSSSLAHQMTMVDKQLFMQLTTLELGRLQKDKSTRRTPCLSALMSFAQRVVCLVVGNVLSGKDVKARAVRIVMYVGVAYKCHQLHNLQSAVSVLRGLQSPPVYRLRRSWAYVRRRHASKYRRFQDLSRRYLDPRLPLYQKTYDDLTSTPPYLPCVATLVAALLCRLPTLPRVQSAVSQSDCSSLLPFTSSAAQPSLPKPLRKFISAFSIYPPPQTHHPLNPSCQSETHLHAVSKEILLENLDKFFAPVTVSCPARRQLEDIQYFLETSQGAASRYAIPANPRVRSFLLQESHDTIEKLFSLSRRLEP